VSFRVKAVGDPSAGIQEVWITYSGVHPGRWESLDLRQSATDSTLWTGALTLPQGVAASDVRFIVQAVNGVGVTSLDDNFGAYYAPAAGAAQVPQDASLKLVSPPAAGVYRSSAAVTAELTDTSSGAPLSGEPVTFAIGGSTRAATTGSDGRAAVSVPLTDLPGGYRLTAAFAGDAGHTATSASLDGFTITSLPTTLDLSPRDSALGAGSPGPTVTLTAGGAPLPEQTVLLVLTRADDSVVARIARITDRQGQVRIADASIPAGDYRLTAYFGGTIGPITLGDPTPYTAASAQGTLHVTASTSASATVGGSVPATLSLSLGAPAQFGAFTPGADRTYDATTTLDVVSTAGDATLSVTDPGTTATGRLVNGSFSLGEPLQVRANAAAFTPLSSTAGSPLGLLTYTGPVSHDTVTLGFRQHIRAGEGLRTGTYSKALTLSLSTTTP
jgi:hypothetical protein